MTKMSVNTFKFLAEKEKTIENYHSHIIIFHIFLTIFFIL